MGSNKECFRFGWTLYAKGYSGQGVRLGIIDSSVRAEHPEVKVINASFGDPFYLLEMQPLAAYGSCAGSESLTANSLLTPTAKSSASWPNTVFREQINSVFKKARM